MSGVVDDNGVQWERCNECSKWVRYEELRYKEPSAEHQHGRDLCPRCEVALRLARLVKRKE